MSALRKQKAEDRRREEALPDPTQLVDGELRKSADTRLRIMEAAVHCLATHGYAGVNALSVAEQAGLTRPAMLYHFPTRLALIEAAIHFVVRRRIEIFEQEVASIGPGAGGIARAIDQAWAQNQTPLYRAYCELANAAHTDPELAAVFAPAMAEYDRARRASAMALFTPAQKASKAFHLRRDLTRFLLDGLATHGWFDEDGDRRRAEMIGFLKALSEPEAGPLLEKAAAFAKKPKRAKRPKG